MWSYYGSKFNASKYYPAPLYPTIIEPFAGAAWYSVRHRHKNVILNEKNKVVYDIWNWLIKEMPVDAILEHTNFYLGDDIRELNLSAVHQYLLGFCVNQCSAVPRYTVQRWSCHSKQFPKWASTTSYQLKRIARLIPDISHWNINYGNYRGLLNVEATWFIDPPYQKGGKHYPEHKLDYSHLAEWCQERKGQIIVCENDGAKWLPFKPLVLTTGQRRKTMEMVWTNQK